MRARVAAASNRANTATQQRPQTTSSYVPPVYEEMQRARGGLDVGLHPALLGETPGLDKSNKNKSSQFRPLHGRKTDSPAPEKARLDLSGPSMEEIKSNPYYDASLGPKNTTAKGRLSKQLVFNQRGKYVQQAAALRRQAQLEATKRRIAELARKAGMDEDLDTERAFLVPAPPDIEWWDEGLINGSSYDAMSNPANLKIETEDTVITIYVQHPVLLEPPQEKIMPTPKPMYLTTKEQKKMRRQRRQAELKETQAKIRLGLEPPPPPKIKKGNLMRVLGEEAVKDPTAVEARVNREIAERIQKHDDTNEERKLTTEQREEKTARQQADDAARGIHVRVYKIDSFVNGKHRYQVGVNAEQNALTGVCIMHPRMNLVVVEGGEHSVRNYDKLMSHRIRWGENEMPRAPQEGKHQGRQEREREELQQKGWLSAVDEETGELKDLTENECVLVFSGEAKQRGFRKWLGARVCETDAQAKDVLARAKMDAFWNVARSFKKEGV